MHHTRKTGHYEILLAAVIGARATSFLFSKILLRSIAPFNLLALRFLLAFGLLAVLFHKTVFSLKQKTVLSGLAVGFLFFLTMTMELQGLRQADSSLVSLLENCSIIFVPLFEILLLRKLPDKTTVLSVLIAMAGVVALALHQGSLSGGFGYGLLAGACYALAILATAKLTHENPDTLGMGIVQVGTIGALSLAASFVMEQPQLPQEPRQWLMLLVLTVVCTGFGFTLQPRAQSHVSADRAGLFCAISPAIATLLGVTVLGEKLGLLSVLGLGLILLSILLTHLITRLSSGTACMDK